MWKGTISFGLVNIPIALYPATRRAELKFRLLRASDLSPVSYRRIAEADGKEVPWDRIVKGYEYEDGKFVFINEEDFQRVDVEATQTVDILDFVLLEEIDERYFYKLFYVEPGKGGAKAYALLRDALRETGKAGIAKVVIKTRQYLAAVKPYQRGLLLELMHFSDELVEPGEIQLPQQNRASRGEMEMARSLIERMTKDWQPEQYKDDYKSALMSLIEKRIESGGRAPQLASRKSRRPTNVIDLMDKLRQSLEANRTSKADRKGPARGATGRRKAA